MIRMGLGVAVGARVGEGAVVPPAENLLLWTEAFDNAVWTKTNCSVSADAALDPDNQMTAERVTNSSGGSVAQISGTAALTGADVTQLVEVAVADAWERFQVPGTFDGQQYTFSVYIKNDGTPVRLRLGRSGGFLYAKIEDLGDEAVYDVCRAQLETGGSATTYVPRTT